jgi:hypothetical protein
MKWLRRYRDEKEPTLKNFAEVVRSFIDGACVLRRSLRR